MMRFTTLFVLLFAGYCIPVISQNKEAELKKKFWNSSDADFQKAKCADRWKNESAVILCKSYEYQVRKEIIMNILYENIYSHSRILLLDKASVENYSTFSFDISKRSGLAFGWNNYNNVYLGLKVIKPDGTEKEIIIDRSLVDEYRQGFNKKSIQKVAVPNLEVGDIIDFYFAIEKQISVGAFYSFSPVIYPLVDDYPVEKHKIELHIMRKCFLNARSMNFAPELKLEDDSKRSDMVYSLTDTNRDRIKSQLFVFPLRELPVLAFQTCFVNNPMVKNHYCFYDKEDVIKKSISNEELKAFVNNILMEGNALSSKIIKYLNKNFKDVTDRNILVREAYYYYRQYSYGKSFESRLLGYSTTNSLPGDFEFVSTMSAVLKHYKISHSVEIAVPREIGHIDDLIMLNQMGLFIRIYGSDNLKYLFNFDAFRLVDDKITSYTGIDYKTVSVATSPEYMTVKTDSTPQVPASENIYKTFMDVAFSAEDADTLTIQTEVEAKGALKSDLQELAITAGDYTEICKNDPYFPNENNVTNGNNFKKLTQMYQDSYQERDKSLTEYFKTNFNVNDLKISGFVLSQPGIWEKEPEFKGALTIKLNQFISRAGNNIILNIGQLIGVQVRPEKADSVRLYDIYMPFARTFENFITVRIPEGYQVKNLNKLNYNVSNVTGGFISSTKVEGDKLTVTTKKYFTANYFPGSYWPDLVLFIDAANDFQNQKIMFTPAI